MDPARPADRRAWALLRWLRPARARGRNRRLALLRPGHRRCRCCGCGRVRKRHDASASADAVGSPFGSQAADHLCGAYLDCSSAW